MMTAVNAFIVGFFVAASIMVFLLAVLLVWLLTR